MGGVFIIGIYLKLGNDKIQKAVCSEIYEDKAGLTAYIN